MAEQADLTPRESEVLDLLRLGLTNEEIAGRLGITLDGAKYHVSQIISKLGVRDRYEAASWAKRRPGSTAALAPLGVLWSRASSVLPVKLSGVAAMASVAVLAVTTGVLGLIIVLFARAGAPEPTVEAVPPLLVPSRDRLSICVDSGGAASVGEQERHTVEGLVQDALAEAPSPPPEFSNPTVTLGCPPSVILGDIALDDTERAVGTDFLLPSEQPSPHRVHVYFVTSTELELVIDRTHIVRPGYSLGSEEAACVPDTCEELTSGVYFEVAADPTRLGEALGVALRLRPIPEGVSPTPDYRDCVQGTPQTWCDRYEACSRPNPDPSCKEFWEESGLEPPQ